MWPNPGFTFTMGEENLNKRWLGKLDTNKTLWLGGGGMSAPFQIFSTVELPTAQDSVLPR